MQAGGGISGGESWDPWSTTSSDAHGTYAVPSRTMAKIKTGVTAGSDRYANFPVERQEYLARLGSPDIRPVTDKVYPRGRNGERTRPAKMRPIVVNIFEDIARQASCYDVGSGRAVGANYYRGGQRGHIAGPADLGNDQHYGVLGERAVKQCITDGYNHEDCDGSLSRERTIARLMEVRERANPPTPVRYAMHLWIATVTQG